MFPIPKMEIQNGYYQKSTFFEGDWQFGFIETNVDDIIDGIISNKYKYHETLDLRNQ
jgi:hypothetical protein